MDEKLDALITGNPAEPKPVSYGTVSRRPIRRVVTEAQLLPATHRTVHGASNLSREVSSSCAPSPRPHAPGLQLHPAYTRPTLAPLQQQQQQQQQGAGTSLLSGLFDDDLQRLLTELPSRQSSSPPRSPLPLSTRPSSRSAASPSVPNSPLPLHLPRISGAGRGTTAAAGTEHPLRAAPTTTSASELWRPDPSATAPASPLLSAHNADNNTLLQRHRAPPRCQSCDVLVPGMVRRPPRVKPSSTLAEEALQTEGRTAELKQYAYVRSSTTGLLVSGLPQATATGEPLDGTNPMIGCSPHNSSSPFMYPFTDQPQQLSPAASCTAGTGIGRNAAGGSGVAPRTRFAGVEYLMAGPASLQSQPQQWFERQLPPRRMAKSGLSETSRFSDAGSDRSLAPGRMATSGLSGAEEVEQQQMPNSNRDSWLAPSGGSVGSPFMGGPPAGVGHGSDKVVSSQSQQQPQRRRRPPYRGDSLLWEPASSIKPSGPSWSNSANETGFSSVITERVKSGSLLLHFDKEDALLDAQLDDVRTQALRLGRDIDISLSLMSG